METKAATLQANSFEYQGLRFILSEDHAIANFSLGVSIASGSVDDPPKLEGLTHATMEMLLRGTQQRSRNQINEEVEFLGATLDSYVGLNSAGLGGETLTRYGEKFVALMSDCLLNPRFQESEWHKLRTETVDMFKLSLNDDSFLGRKNFTFKVYGDHPYSRPVDGTISSLDRISIASMRERYTNMVRRGLITITASGDISEATLKAWVDKYFSSIAPGGARAPKLPPPKPLKGRQLVIVNKPDRSQIQLFIGHPAIPANNPDVYPLSIGNTAFGGLFKSRYQSEIRVKRGWSYGASSNLALNRDGGSFVMRTFTAAANLGKVVRRSLEMLTELTQDGISAEELEKAKSNQINEFPFMLDTADKRVQEAMRLELYELPKNYFDKYRDNIAKQSGADVAKALRKHLDPNNCLIVAVCEATKCRAELEKAIDSLAETTVVPYDKL